MTAALLSSRSANLLWALSLALVGFTSGVICLTLMMPSGYMNAERSSNNYKLRGGETRGDQSFLKRQNQTDRLGGVLADGNAYLDEDEDESYFYDDNDEYFFDGVDVKFDNDEYEMMDGDTKLLGLDIDDDFGSVYSYYSNDGDVISEYTDIMQSLEGIDGSLDEDSLQLLYESYEYEVDEWNSEFVSVASYPAIADMDKSENWAFLDPYQDSILHTPEILDGYFELYGEDEN